jgi:hemolysin activation/secretion protein
LASDPLFSAEEFGYGGQTFGRAFDASELTGDHGLVASFELKYNGLARKGIFAFQPYGFYDIGRLWNKDTAQPNRVSAASAGFGVLVSNNYGMFANLSFAMPLVRSVQTPIYGQGDDDPRISFNVSQEF